MMMIPSIAVFPVSSDSECPWYKIENQQYEAEFRDFLDRIVEAECFLQVSSHATPTPSFRGP